MRWFHRVSKCVSVWMLGFLLTAATLAAAQQPAEEPRPLYDGDPVCCPSSAGCWDPCCDPCCSRWSLMGFGTVNGFKGPMDLDDQNANFGVTAGANGGFVLLEELGIGAQLGGSYLISDFQGTEFTGSEDRRQTFATFGLFRRPEDHGWKLGLVYDIMHDRYHSTYDFTQWRGLLGYQFEGRNELGVWAALPDRGDEAVLSGSLNHFKSFTQVCPYWQRIWEGGAVTNLWMGVADNHHNQDLLFGGAASCPVNKYLAVLGGFEYIMPGSGASLNRERDAWSVYTGVAIYFGGTARCQSRAPATPVLPVADPGTFAITRN